MMRNLLLLFCCISIISCEASSDHERSQIDIKGADRYRQILTSGDHPLRIDIVMNRGRNQRFTITSGEPQFDLAVTGINEGTSNFIQITFTEMLNGWPVILAHQEQGFIANGNVVIDAEHQSDLFDNDNDGFSNFDERARGTCVWFADESCLADGGIDLPQNAGTQTGADDVLIHDGYAQNGTTVSSEEIEGGNATLIDIDFSSGNSVWSSSSEITSSQGNLCVTVRNDHVGKEFLIAEYNNNIRLEAASYLVQFDVRVDRRAPVGTNSWPVSTFYHYMQATEAWQTKTVRFENSVAENVQLSIFGVHANVDTKYCFDNIKLVRL